MPTRSPPLFGLPVLLLLFGLFLRFFRSDGSEASAGFSGVTDLASISAKKKEYSSRSVSNSIISGDGSRCRTSFRSSWSRVSTSMDWDHRMFGPVIDPSPWIMIWSPVPLRTELRSVLASIISTNYAPLNDVILIRNLFFFPQEGIRDPAASISTLTWYASTLPRVLRL